MRYFCASQQLIYLAWYIICRWYKFIGKFSYRKDRSLPIFTGIYLGEVTEVSLCQILRSFWITNDDDNRTLIIPNPRFIPFKKETFYDMQQHYGGVGKVFYVYVYLFYYFKNVWQLVINSSIMILLISVILYFYVN